MFSDLTLILINVICIFFLITMLIVLAAATRMKGAVGWTAAIFFLIHIPIILVSLIREVAPEYWLYFAYPAYTVDILPYPAIWFFTRSRMDKSFRLRPRDLLHAVPALVSLAAHILYYAPLSADRVQAEIEWMQAGGKNLPLTINNIIVHPTFIVYTALTIRYVYKRMKYLRDNFSDSDYIEIRWMPRFIAVYFSLVFISAVGYTIDPNTNVWLIPVANTVGMAYLVYCVIFHSTTAYINRIGEAPSNSPERGELSPFGGVRGGLSQAYMKEICDRVINYLTTTGAYTNPALSLSMLSAETGITNKNISRSINSYLKKNFFDLINEMRVEKAKEALCSLGDNHTIDSVAHECGFHSRATFFSAFKKAEGKTPTQWLQKK
ncbi:MAG: helix-turn-helix domain-containing protein [Tannerella sp.]|jgi:AraC-like DNA-binding protein|nr:helix-turn-helix domain-containing protein [Tannerella sp.]